jgi:hypothetical protein
MRSHPRVKHHYKSETMASHRSTRQAHGEANQTKSLAYSCSCHLSNHWMSIFAQSGRYTRWLGQGGTCLTGSGEQRVAFLFL